MNMITTEDIEKFKWYLIEDEKSDNTIEKYIRDITAFMLWTKERDVNKKNVLLYKNELITRYAPTSVNSIISSLNAYFIFRGWYDCKVKGLKIQKQIFMNKNKELSKAEYERLLMAAKRKKNQKLYYLMQAICSTGIRISELCYITVEAIKTGQAIIRCKGKVRIVILPRQLCKMLKTYLKCNCIKEGPVFVTKTGKAIDRSNVWKLLKSLCESAGVSKDKVFPHNFRHLFARTYYSIEKDVVRLADILGHSSVNTTRIYTKETGELHRLQIQRLGLLQYKKTT